MKNILRYLPCFTLLLMFSTGLWAHSHPILEKIEFELRPKAISTFGIKSIPIEKLESIVPLSALLFTLDQTQVYILRGTHFLRIPAQVRDRFLKKALITVSEYQKGDEIVVHGVEFLRVAELGSQGEELEHHAH